MRRLGLSDNGNESSRVRKVPGTKVPRNFRSPRTKVLQNERARERKCKFVHRKLLWKWVEYICKELFIYLFTYLFVYIFFRKLNYLPTGQSRRPIFALDGSNDVESCKDMPCWVLLELQPEWDMGRFFETQPSSKFLYPAQPMEAFTWFSPTITDTRQLKNFHNRYATYRMKTWLFTSLVSETGRLNVDVISSMVIKILTLLITKYGSPNILGGWFRIFAYTLWQAGSATTINFKTPHYLKYLNQIWSVVVWTSFYTKIYSHFYFRLNSTWRRPPAWISHISGMV